jgi:opacity protein-like surface antigen
MLLTMKYYRFSFLFCLLTFFVSCATFANAPKTQWSITGGLGYGVSTSHANETVSVIPQFEQTNVYRSDSVVNNAPFLGIGVNYGISLSPKLRLTTGLSAHYLSNLPVRGDIIENGAPSSATFSYRVDSLALTGDAALFYTLPSLPMDSVYTRVSLGVSQNTASHYQRYNGAGNASPSVAFTRHTQSGFAYGIGLGMRFALSERLSVGPEYQYWQLGDVSLGKGRNVLSQAVDGLKGGALAVHSLLLVNLSYQF